MELALLRLYRRAWAAQPPKVIDPFRISIPFQAPRGHLTTANMAKGKKDFYAVIRGHYSPVICTTWYRIQSAIYSDQNLNLL